MNQKIILIIYFTLALLCQFVCIHPVLGQEEDEPATEEFTEDPSTYTTVSTTTTTTTTTTPRD